MNYEHLAAAANHIRTTTGREHSAAVILGSGLSDYATSFPDAIELPYSTVPNFPTTKIEGHAGSLFSVPVDASYALLFAGRVHTYEGWAMSDVVFGVRVAGLAGCHTVVLTNAAGGVGEGLEPGDLVAISDHLNLTGRNPLVGDNDDRLGTRFPDMSTTYDIEVRAAIAAVMASEGIMPVFSDGRNGWPKPNSYRMSAGRDVT